VAFIAYAQLSSLDDRFDGTVGFDFRGTLYEPARHVLQRKSPYVDLADDAAIGSGNPAVYPPLSIVGALPLAPLDFEVAYAVWALLLLGAVVAALLIVGVRDWRCHALALLSPPVLQSAYVGNITLLLALPLALAWRSKELSVRAGLALGTAIAIKPLLVPMVGWLLITRRFTASAVAVASSVALAVGPWAAIGFDGFREYPRLLDRIDSIYGLGSYSVPSAFWQIAERSDVRHLICLVVAVVFFGAAVVLRNSRDGDIRTFSIMLTACIAASPIVWPHYLALLLVPIGIVCPRVGPLWLYPYALPLVLNFDDRLLRAGGFIAFVLVMTAVILASSRRSLARVGP
jgi:hypothetical protein